MECYLKILISIPLGLKDIMYHLNLVNRTMVANILSAFTSKKVNVKKCKQVVEKGLKKRNRKILISTLIIVGN